MNTSSVNKPLVYLFSDANFLSINILETLLSKNCLVNVVTNDDKNWKEKTFRISGARRFSILPIKNFTTVRNIDYAIFVQGFIKNENPYSDFKSFRKQNLLKNTKTLVIIPFERFSLKESSVINLDDNAGVVYVGDLLGPRMDLESKLLISRCLAEVLTMRSITLGDRERFYPVFAPDIAKTVTKWLLSFGPFGKEVFLLGPETSTSLFWKMNESLISGIKIRHDSEAEPRFLPKNYEVKTVNSDLRFCLSETYRYMAGGGNKILSPRIAKNLRVSRKFLSSSMVGAFILLFPAICFLVASGLLYLSLQGLLNGRDGNFQNVVLTAKTFYVIGRGESDLLGYIPFVGRPYKEISFVSRVGEKVGDLSLIAPTLIKSSSSLFTRILGNEIYDPQNYSDQIKDDLGNIFQDVSVLEAETKEGTDSGLTSAKWLMGKIDFEKVKNLSLQGETLAGRLPSILGKDEKKTYLVLFQNNMELRPTGGFIGSYGTATFDGGRMIELNVNDVYSADGQLRGHVEPPAAIKNYLGEANWWLRDSNWDPDFPTSAQRAEWFLDKEVDTQVDGVAGIDLSLVKDFLKYTGSIFLPDYNLDITTDNLYEKTQAEVRDNFFAGSRKKASFLTALCRNLIVEVGRLNGKNELLVLKAIFDNLERRHAQVFLHDDISQGAVSALGFSGEVLSPSCGDFCYPDMAGIIEANVGVNKANFFVSRSMDMNVAYTPNGVKRDLRLNIQNSANSALGPSGTYKAYIRLLVPGDSQVLGVKNIIGQSEQDLSPEIIDNKGRKEVGVIVEVLGGQNESLEFSWQSNFPEAVKNYALYIRKQAGVSGYPFTLTVNANPIYNTTLDQDLWTKKY